MPIIYLSPSTQDWNHFVNGGTEEYYMNLIADAMEPYLLSSGIRWVRNTPDMTAASSIAQSNHGNYDLHLALHSNAAPEGRPAASGLGGLLLPDERRRETGGRHHRGEPQGDLPLPLAGQDGPDHQARRGRQDARAGVLIEFAYHDNLEDAEWIKANIAEIAANVAYSLTDYFGIPFVLPQAPRRGTVVVRSGWLNIRQFPSTESQSIARAWNGDPIIVNGSGTTGTSSTSGARSVTPIPATSATRAEGGEA